MLMLEHHAKLLLSSHGIPVPEGVLVDDVGTAAPPFAAPWIVKAQVPVGGRGKAGFIATAGNDGELRAALKRMIHSSMKGHVVHACRVEQAVDAPHEAYFSLSVDARRALVNVLVSADGGIEIESKAGSILAGAAAPRPEAIAAEIERLTSQLPHDVGAGLCAAGLALSTVFLACDLTLLEVNPLFILTNGAWIIGDAKVIADDNALVRQPQLRALVDECAAIYPDVAFKMAQGFDFVVLDPDGEVGLVTTGAGLSMKLVDELAEIGASPFNFCDIRTGQMRGDPARLIFVLRRMASAPRIRAVLINVFAGITNLVEFADLLVRALDAVPQLQVPIIVRLVGNAEAQATAMLGAMNGRGRGFVLEPDLDRAMALVSGALPRKAGQIA